MRMMRSRMDADHPDFAQLAPIRDAILAMTGGPARLHRDFPETIRSAIDFVLDPIRTGRTTLAELDNVEKTFVGLKVEHCLRDLLGAPKGIRDLVIAGRDVDVKNTLDNAWMIPPETYATEDPCLVVTSKADPNRCWLGLMLARHSYLNAPNRDGKRGVTSQALRNVLWLVDGAPYPASVWAGFDMALFNRLRHVQPGTQRAVRFFRATPNREVPREVVQALLHDQLDPLKRLRRNGGARGVLEAEGVALLSGSFGRQVLRALGRPDIAADAFVAIAPRDARERAILERLDALPGGRGGLLRPDGIG